MASKRLLDAARLVNAGSHVAKQHLALRRDQWDVYSRTSSLAKAAKSQTDRVTVTAGAAWELARRLNETGPSWQHTTTEHTPPRKQQSPGTDQTSRSFTESENRPDQAGTAQQSVHVGTEPPARDSTQYRNHEVGDEHSDSLRKREHQRISEGQIPTRSAGTPPQSRQATQDTFDQRAESSSAVLSSLPRTKIPKHASSPNTQDRPTETVDINQDVFYVPGEAAKIQSSGALPDDASISDVFHSRRLSRMLDPKASGTANPYAGRKKAPATPLPEMLAAEQRWNREKTATPEPTSAEVMSSSATEAKGRDADGETADLAQSIAEDTSGAVSPASLSSSSPEREMHESRVPSSRFGRLWQYGGLATSMAFGAVGEGVRRAVGGSDNGGSLMLSESNTNKLVAKLSRMRGAALKMGQMMSFQGTQAVCFLSHSLPVLFSRSKPRISCSRPAYRDCISWQWLCFFWCSNETRRPDAGQRRAIKISTHDS